MRILDSPLLRATTVSSLMWWAIFDALKGAYLMKIAISLAVAIPILGVVAYVGLLFWGGLISAVVEGEKQLKNQSKGEPR